MVGRVHRSWFIHWHKQILRYLYERHRRMLWLYRTQLDWSSWWRAVRDEIPYHHHIWYGPCSILASGSPWNRKIACKCRQQYGWNAGKSWSAVASDFPVYNSNIYLILVNCCGPSVPWSYKETRQRISMCPLSSILYCIATYPTAR